METFVFRFLESVLVTLDTAQFCTEVICKMPQVDKNKNIRIKKKEILCFGFLKITPQARAHPNNKIIKSRVEEGNT